MKSNINKIQFLQRRGNLLTFMKCLDNGNNRMISNGLEYDENHRVRIKGHVFNSEWYNNIDELIKGIDWIYMKRYGFCRELV